MLKGKLEAVVLAAESPANGSVVVIFDDYEEQCEQSGDVSEDTATLTGRDRGIASTNQDEQARYHDYHVDNGFQLSQGGRPPCSSLVKGEEGQCLHNESKVPKGNVSEAAGHMQRCTALPVEQGAHAVERHIGVSRQQTGLDSERRGLQ